MVSDLDHDDNACRKSRREKTYRFMRDRIAYMRDVVRSIEGLERKTEKHDHKKLCVRMNGSSDIAWESIKCERDGVKHPNLMAAFPHIQFVDYTKKASRFDRALPANYHLTFSRSEINESDCVRLLERGVNVAVVFERKPLSWRGHVCIDGDEHDLRHLDAHAENGAAGYVVALTPKGRRAKADQSGFVVRSR